MTESRSYQMRFWAPAAAGRPGQGKQGYARPEAAVANARSAAVSRQLRAPGSHVIVIDNARMLVLWEWHGGDDTDYPESEWERACQYDLADEAGHRRYAVAAVVTVDDEHDGRIRLCAACAAHRQARRDRR